MQSGFFGSKLNTVLLCILIILMVIAIKIMLRDKEAYLDAWQTTGAPEQLQENNNGSQTPPPKNTGTLPLGEILAKIKAKDNGPLAMCTIEGDTYILAQGIVFDGSNNLYNTKAELVAACGGGWGIKPDPYPALCVKLETTQCKSIEEGQ